MQFPRLQSRGGGVGLVFNSFYTVKVLPKLVSINSCDLLRVRISSGSTRTFYIYVLYRPPIGSKYAVSDSVFHDDLDVLLSEATICVAPVILIADFNIHYNKFDKSGKIRSLCDIYNMVQHVQVPTHIHGNTLDLVLSYLDDNLISSLSMYDVALSDHYLVEMNLNINKHKQPSKYTVNRCLRNIDIAAFKSEVVDISDNIMIGSYILSCIDLLNKTQRTLIDNHAPLKRTRITTRPHPWYNNDIHQVKLHRRTCEREWRVKNCLSSRNDYVNARNYVTKLIKVYKITYYKDILGNVDNKSMFSLIKSLVSIETRALPDFNSLYDGCVVFSDFFSEKAKMLVMNLENNNMNVEIPVFNNTLSDFRATTETEVYNICMNTKKTCSLDPLPTSVLQPCFQSLAPAYTHIINMSLSQGKVPASLKDLKLIPLLKKQSLDPNVLSNYRPVSNLPQLSKTLEKVVDNQLMDHANNMSDMYQSAYRKHHSTETVLLCVTNDIIKALY